MSRLARGPSTGAPGATPAVRFVDMKATQGTYYEGLAVCGQLVTKQGRRGCPRRVSLPRSGRSTASTRRGTTSASPGRSRTATCPPMLDIECPDGDANCLGPGYPGVRDGRGHHAGHERLAERRAGGHRARPRSSTPSPTTSRGTASTPRAFRDYPLYIATIRLQLHERARAVGGGDPLAIRLDRHGRRRQPGRSRLTSSAPRPTSPPSRATPASPPPRR